jgi:serine/threonine-protein kinase
VTLQGVEHMDKATESASGKAALDLTGRTLDDYHVLRKLGQGGMGQLYLAEQVSLKRKVALKILRPELAANPTALQRFEAEAKAVAQATHANIVQVYAIGQVEGLPYMALEYVEGRNLREYLERKGPPDVLQALSIMRQVAAALQRAGELGIIHRDIKPDNILLTRKGEVKVADFGLARSLVGDQAPLHLTQSGFTIGTPLYMSPEQVEGKTVDPRSDIYSFGVTSYHMLAGQPPFRGEGPFEIALAHLRAAPPPLASIRPDLPETLCAVVHKMMAKDPAQRYQTGGELLKDIGRLRESLGGTTGTPAVPTVTVAKLPSGELLTKPDTSAQEPGSPSQPRWGPLRLPWLVGVSLLVALIGGVLFGWVRRHYAGPLYPGVTPPPVDLPEGEPLTYSQRIQAKRELAENYLRSPKNLPNIAGAYLVCMDLGLEYLEANRLDDAEKLFKRLDGIVQVRPYHFLGHLGRGIVEALRNHPEESNTLFAQVFDNQAFQNLHLKGLENPKQQQNPDVFMWAHPEWRYWMGKAVDCNRKNGLPEKDVPALLQKLYPPRR